MDTKTKEKQQNEINTDTKALGTRSVTAGEESTDESATGKNLYVGIDLALKTNYVVILDDGGNKQAGFSMSNDAIGAKELRDKLIVLVEKQEITKLVVGMEATNIYWWHLHQYISQDKLLAALCTVCVHTINPKLIKQFKKSFSKLDKTDPIDAYVIAQRVRFGGLSVSSMIDEVYEPLKRLTRFRFHLVENLVSEKNYLLTQLFLKYSSWQKLKPFSNVCSKTASEMIADMDIEELAQMPVEELVEKVLKTSKGSVVDPQKTAKLLKQVVQESYALKESMHEPIDIILTNTYENISYFQSKIKNIDSVIQKEFERYANTLTSIPGIGMVFAAGITSEIGSLSHYPTEKHVASYAGLSWSRHQSGEFSAEETHIKQGNQYLRYYLIQAANSLRIHNEEYKTYYQKKYEEVPIHQHKRALVLTARKLVRLLYAMLRDKRLYTPEEKKTKKK